MSAPVDFLHSLGQVFSAMGLYGEKHAARERAIDQSWDALLHLLEQDRAPVFNFLDGEVIFANQRLGELEDWKWTGELTRGAVERIEITEGVARQDFRSFLVELRARMTGATDGEESKPRPEVEFPCIRFGPLSVGQHESEQKRGLDSSIDLREEADATGWIHEQATLGHKISSTVAGAVVECLWVALREERNALGLLVPVKEIDQYTVVHSMNTSILAMGLAEMLGFGGADVKAIGEAALLHDVGKGQIPADIIQKPGRLTPEEWEVVKTHPAEGARILVNSGPETELAAIVAYEHHIKYDGSGYPDVHYQRKLHPATRLVQVCDVYDALRTRRPFREPWPIARIASHLNEESGKGLYPDAVLAFKEMLDRWEAEDPDGP